MFFFRTKSQERVGEIYSLLSAVLFAGFPIIIHYASDKLPPIFYAGASMLAAGVLMFVIMTVLGNLKDLTLKKAWPPMLMVTIFVIILPSILLYTGTGMTSGINTSLLLSSQVIFALIITSIAGEVMTRYKLLGGLMVFFGTLLILYNGTLQLRQGDLLIIAAAVLFPIGNVYAKKALRWVHPTTILFVRSFLGGAALLLFSPFLFREVIALNGTSWREFLFLVLMNGFLLFGISKVFWYEGLRRLAVGKATILVMSFPAFSMILATIFLREIPTLYQFAGLLIIFAGLYAATFHKDGMVAHGL